jgi:hypothetical protein
VRQRILLVALAGLALVLGLAACGASSGEGDQASGPQTYTSDAHGFSLTYDGDAFEEADSVEADNEAGATSSFDVAFIDGDGAQVDGKYVEGVQVSVYQLDTKVKPGQVKKLKKAFSGLVDEMVATTGGDVTQPLAPMELNGTPGFNFGYTYRDGDVDLKAATFFLVKGDKEYTVTGQASQSRWEELAPALESAIMSFTLR